jgi:hypothetical protein
MSPRPGIGEVKLPGMDEIPRPFPELSSQIAFGHAATPEFLGLNPDNYVDIDQHMMSLVTPDRLRPSLIGFPRNQRGEFCISYVPGGADRTPMNIALTPDEYHMVPLTIPSFWSKVVAKTLKSHPPDPRRDYSETVASALRSGVHALESKATEMEAYLEGTLKPDMTRIEKFSEAARNPGARRMRGDKTLIELRWLLDHIHGDMFTAIRYQRGWSSEQESLARRALERRLFFERQHNTHIKNWRDEFAFDLEYTGHKVALYSDRIWQARKFIKDKTEPTAAS